MKIDIVLIALAVGLIVFLFRIDHNSSNANTFKYQGFACLGIYYGMKRYNDKIIDLDSKHKIVFKDSFLVGFRMCLIASIFAGILYSILPDSDGLTYESSKFLRILDVSLSIMIIGTIVAVGGALILVKRQF